MRILVLGMGRMGQALTERLLRDHEVLIWNRTPHRAAVLAEAGAHEVSDRNGAAEKVDVLITSLAGDEAVREVVLGEDGTMNHLADALYVDCSTISPRLSDELAACHPDFAAMPIIGGPHAVRSGEAHLLFGSTSPRAHELEPVLAAVSYKVTHYQSSKLASAAKVASDLLLLSGLGALSEASVVASRGGLDLEQIRELFSESPFVASGILDRLNGVLRTPTEVSWTVELGLKDLQLALEVAGTAAQQLAITRSTVERLSKAKEEGFAANDLAAVGQVLRSVTTDNSRN